MYFGLMFRPVVRMSLGSMPRFLRASNSLLTTSTFFFQASAALRSSEETPALMTPTLGTKVTLPSPLTVMLAEAAPATRHRARALLRNRVMGWLLSEKGNDETKRGSRPPSPPAATRATGGTPGKYRGARFGCKKCDKSPR